jgi:hypothetical protein
LANFTALQRIFYVRREAYELQQEEKIKAE